MGKHDYSQVPEKQQARLETLRVVREHAPFLWDRQKKCLSRDWAELTSVGDPTYRMLLDDKALQSGRGKYIGVNGPDPSNPDGVAAETEARAILEGNRKLYGTDLAHWAYGRLEDLLMAEEGMANVGVLVVDGFYSVGDHDIAATQAPFIRFSQEQVRYIGQCLLVTNLVVRGSVNRRVEEALEMWAGVLARSVGLDQLPEGRMHIYRGKSWRMVTTRVLYEASGVAL